jgi:hypothetical protein
MIGKKYRVTFDKKTENPYFTKLHKFVKENRLKAILHPLYLENENTVIILVLAESEVHNKVSDSGFSLV